MRTSVAVLGAFLLLVGAAGAHAQTAPPIDQNHVAGVAPATVFASAKTETLRLDNGAKLVVLYDAQATTVVAEAFFAVGLADEQRKNGINALIARLWTNESESRDAALIEHDIAKLGAIGTSLSHDWVELWGVSAANDYDQGELLRAMLTQLVAAPRFSTEFLADGKADVARAAAIEQDTPLSATLNALRARAFSESMYGRTLFGDSNQRTSDEVGAYYQRYFRPERAVFVIAGPITSSRAKEMVEHSLGAGGWNVGKAAPPLPTVPVETVPAGLRPLVLPVRAPATITALGFLAPGTGNVRRIDWATLLILDAVLGGGKASRLFHALRDGETSVGYDVRTTLMPGRGQSLWAVYVTGDSAGETARAALSSELAAVASGKKPVTEAELTRARTYLLARHAEDRQRLRDRAWGAGWAELMGLGADFDTDLSARVALVSTEDVNRMAHELFSANAAVVYTLPNR